MSRGPGCASTLPSAPDKDCGWVCTGSDLVIAGMSGNIPCVLPRARLHDWWPGRHEPSDMWFGMDYDNTGDHYHCTLTGGGG